MFPAIEICLEGLNAKAKYVVLMDVVPLDDCKYQYSDSKWMAVGKADHHPGVGLPPSRYYIHPDSPATGGHWMKKSNSFRKVKITNNCLDDNGHV